MTKLVSRVEFRVILKRVIDCVNDNLPSPIAPLTADETYFWLREITREDIHEVLREETAENRKMA